MQPQANNEVKFSFGENSPVPIRIEKKTGLHQTVVPRPQLQMGSARVPAIDNVKGQHGLKVFAQFAVSVPKRNRGGNLFDTSKRNTLNGSLEVSSALLNCEGGSPRDPVSASTPGKHEVAKYRHVQPRYMQRLNKRSQVRTSGSASTNSTKKGESKRSSQFLEKTKRTVTEDKYRTESSSSYSAAGRIALRSNPLSWFAYRKNTAASTAGHGRTEASVSPQ